MTGTNIFTIRSSDDLLQLGRYARGGRLRLREIKLEVPDLSDAERAAEEERLNRLYFACGCGEATIVGLAGLAAAVIWMAARPGGWADLSWWDLAYAVGAFFVGTGVGKWIGLQRARFALARELQGLRSHFKEKRPPPAKEARCAVS